MRAAVKAVEEGDSVSQAARAHGVPKTTLYDRTSGRVAHGSNPGPRPYLSPGEEKELGAYLKHCAKVGYGKTRRDVLTLVQSATSDRGVLRSSRVSEGWWRRFLKAAVRFVIKARGQYRPCQDGRNESRDDQLL